ncbi:hypothetical protein GDO81_006015 [Engystomops pustulosus]|uniref:XK-related protein n=1 Tax=Engystomops pustulosus TaxID=76066 RepID=A0AAV7CU94_ENGPU|nr:hypothetical protein GDO81_006015 [Engystomops pustulosus]
MPRCPPVRYRLLDLVFSVVGTVAFLGDLGSDMWSTVKYYKAGDTAWAALYIGFYALSSLVLQLLSWGWFWVDKKDWDLLEEAEAGDISGDYVECCSIQAASNGGAKEHRGENGTKSPEDASVVGAVPVLLSDTPGSPPAATTTQDTQAAAGTGHRTAGSVMCCFWTGPRTAGSEHQHIVRSFWTSKIIFRTFCFTVLHVFQLGYPLRCIHSLEVCFAACRHPEDDLYKDYAYFLIHDLSMMRLVETFLENTPQLILILYIIIQREDIETFQYFSISMTFICITWAILGYHQSLRLILKGKLELSIFSSVIYYLWNFCLISSRILCITVFTVTFHWGIIVHFILLWVAFFIWASLQKTSFMKDKFLEIVYRTAVATILYFSWFNIADGRTLYRCVVYTVFIIIDSVILVVSWMTYKTPSLLDGYEMHIIVIHVVLFVVGLSLRLLYYIYLHPNIRNEKKQYADVPDGKIAEIKVLHSVDKTKQQINYRMEYLAAQIY